MSGVVWQRIEGGLVFLAVMGVLLAFGLFAPVGPWWVWLILFFAPDVAMLAYLAGPRVGAALYNLVHLYGFGLIVTAAGLLGLGPHALAAVGLIWVAHAGFDRLFGYGLKEPSGFHDTHLGRIGRRGGPPAP